MDEAVNYLPSPGAKTAIHARLTTLQKAELIRSVELFSETSVEDLYRLAAIAQEVDFSAQQVIYQEEDIGDSFYLIVQGRIECTSDAKKLRCIVGPGQSVGVHSVLTREPRFATATALEDTFALSISVEDFYNLLSTNPEIMANLLKYFFKKVGIAP